MRPRTENFKIMYFAKHWMEPYVQIVTENDGKCCHSVCSLEDEEEPVEREDLLPVLVEPSQLLDDHHIESLANHMPARTQGYPWRLVYSMAVHGSSLKTLYRKMAEVDSPVLLVIKDLEHKVFGAFSSDPFRVSNYCYGTGETFLYSFSPEFQAYRWSGENCYFVRGHLDSLQIGGGGGRFGLWLDSDLYQGSSFTCSTFQNQQLSSEQDFKVLALEVWTVW
ncbi:nuclear receptor coactivator 7-like isoform X2 [Hypomesus transpacificus]|uniref:nuclear receptor coactivator 7-like n=1 Tax=Hypomesus transpacificus TaxID=137520 RepID=UPI001F07A2C2|nr:nuclear receptor coactivator 7-like [Hypomesus transpacificus]XP_046899017.1 nuclear receptor coactivator 7-like isoform X2 [Hypomesus transpacificus]